MEEARGGYEHTPVTREVPGASGALRQQQGTKTKHPLQLPPPARPPCLCTGGLVTSAITGALEQART